MAIMKICYLKSSNSSKLSFQAAHME